MAREKSEKVFVNVALPIDEYLRLEEAVVRKYERKGGFSASSSALRFGRRSRRLFSRSSVPLPLLAS